MSGAGEGLAPRWLDDVYWLPAVFAGTVVGGVVWAVIANYTVLSGDRVLSAGQAWLAVGIGCLVVVLAGLALALRSRSRVLRTAGVALVVVAMSGGSVLAAWGPLLVIAIEQS